MKPTLVLITNHFPFSTGEAFIKQELDVIHSRFKNILIICRNTKSSDNQNSEYSFVRINPQSSIIDYLKLPWLILLRFRMAVECLLDEFNFIKRDSFNIAHYKIMLHDLSKALITGAAIEEILKKQNITGKIVLYSYWLNSSALSLKFIKNKNCQFVKISRAHGGDVYESRHKENYLSFRNSIAADLSAIYFISQDGLNHVKDLIQTRFTSKLQLSRLGVFPTKIFKEYTHQERKLIVSCSYLVPVKRVHLMIEAISLIKTQNIKWVHIGGGPQQEALMRLAAQKLGSQSNIQYEFLGTLTTIQIKEFYKTNDVFLFLNTSESEGVPVTIMEAQSHGIPTLALDVGANREIVNNNTGRLLPNNSTAIDIAEGVENLLFVSPTEINNLRLASFGSWQTNYNAEKNFNTFADQILNLFHEA